MKEILLGTTGMKMPSIVVGCMRLAGKNCEEMQRFLHTSLEHGAYFFDHADIYGGGQSESIFGEAMAKDTSIKREALFLQSKCGIRQGFFDFSKEHIVSSVDGILKRLQTDYLDALLLHRPDALMEPEEVAEAFEELHTKGKVRYFGVSNHKPMQIELLKRYVKQPLHINQLQFSIPVSNMVANGLEVNMTSDGAPDRDGSVLDYSRLNDMTIQAWSPFQMPNWQGCFIDSEKYPKLNEELQVLAEQYGVNKTTIATAWILHHPANMQVVTGTASEARLAEIMEADKVHLTRQEWYRLYLAAGHILP
ncbi:MAG: aldo/keto reductase family oxidoreductase [Lachnospiraceae bacterium]|nr:aldo/keto reductase family oxidoreductase [Lachnospiraceae bacterium]